MSSRSEGNWPPFQLRGRRDPLPAGLLMKSRYFLLLMGSFGTYIAETWTFSPKISTFAGGMKTYPLGVLRPAEI